MTKFIIKFYYTSNQVLKTVEKTLCTSFSFFLPPHFQCILSCNPLLSLNHCVKNVAHALIFVYLNFSRSCLWMPLTGSFASRLSYTLSSCSTNAWGTTTLEIYISMIKITSMTLYTHCQARPFSPLLGWKGLLAWWINTLLVISSELHTAISPELSLPFL